MSVKTLTIGGKAALAYFPSNYDPTKAYPFMVFFPGLGETGTAGTSKLLVHGPFLYLNDTTDLALDLVVLGIEPDEAYGMTVPETTAVLSAITSSYNVEKLYLTGLSLGCQEVMNLIWQPGQDLSMIGGLFMFSADPPNVSPYGPAVVSYPLFKKNSLYYYGGCGTSDYMYGMQYPVYQGILASGAEANWDAWKNVGHSDPVWSDGYNPAWKSPSMNLSIYAKTCSLCPVGLGLLKQPPAPLVYPLASSAQLNLIASPTPGMAYLNTDTKKITYYDGTMWQ